MGTSMESSKKHDPRGVSYRLTEARQIGISYLTTPGLEAARPIANQRLAAAVP